MFCLSPQALAQTKSRAAAKNETRPSALEKLRKDAPSALEAGTFSVVDNELVPLGGDKHDYISFGPYWRPDPAKKGGRPYFRRDDEVRRDTTARRPSLRDGARAGSSRFGLWRVSRPSHSGRPQVS